MRAAALVAVLLLAGCWVTSTSTGGMGYPAGPSLAEFHVRERCGVQDSSCQERAQAVFDDIVARSARRSTMRRYRHRTIRPRRAASR